MKMCFLSFFLGLICAFCLHAKEMLFAESLFRDGDFANAAVEYRRLALASDNENEQAGWYWMSAYSYLKGRDFIPAERTIHRIDNLLNVDLSAIQEQQTFLLAEIAYNGWRLDEANYYYYSLATQTPNETLKAYAIESLVATAVREENFGKARTQTRLAEATEGERMLAALDRYDEKPYKKIWLGGVLGIIPGMGHFYSGEWGNGIRSIILNGLFSWAMIETGGNHDWGLFAVTTFFEITWYSGSIYGGLDAAARYNQRQRMATIDEIRTISAPIPEFSKLPILSLQFSF